MGVFRRVYRVRPLSALLLCLPGLFLGFWYAWQAFARFEQYCLAAGEDRALSVEDFHIQLFDVLRKDLRRMFMPSPPNPPVLDTYRFHMQSDALDTLIQGARQEAQRPYVKARLERAGVLQDVELRLRGSQHWHVLGQQKSLKVRLPRKSLLDGHRVFNLINQPTPMVVEEQIILDLAREHGVLTPTSRFARVHINGADLGVYHFEAQPDESLLRLNRRMPGSLYSGNLPPSAKTSQLWQDVERWKKVAWRNDEDKTNKTELGRLLDHISKASLAQFASFARREIDMQKFATFDALDVVFGGDQHDFRENHKLYFDPYKGRWEPVAWNFRGFKHSPVFNLVDNPLLLRLKFVPGYLSLRNRIVHDLLAGVGSASAVQARGAKILTSLAPELATDPYWDAYKLLPRATRFHRRMIRPMDPHRLALVFESEATTFRRRHAFLMGELKQNPLGILVGDTSEASTAFQLVVDGRVGVQLTGFQVEWSAECPQPGWQVFAEGRPVTPVSQGGRAELARPMDLHPGVGLVSRDDKSPKRGGVLSEMRPVAYPFSLTASCRPERIEAAGIQLATRSQIRSRQVTPAILDRIPLRTLKPDDVPGLLAGETGVHPWRMQSPPPQLVRLGPGSIEVPRSRVFDTHQAVEVAAGTRLAMGEGASLVFFGPVSFNGTRNRPVVIERAGQRPWGGIILQGQATAGSSLVHVVATGGTTPEFGLIPYPGMVNIHDTQRIRMSGCHFGRHLLVAVMMDATELMLPAMAARMSTGSGLRIPPGLMQPLSRGWIPLVRDSWPADVLHVAYVQDLEVEDLLVRDAAVDALDLEFTRSRLRRVEVVRAGDDGLDLMGSDISLVDSILLACSGNAISAGEETRASIRDVLVADSGVGVLAKNAARVDLTDSLLYRNHTGVSVYQRTVRFAGISRVQSDVLYLVESHRDVRRKDRRDNRLDLGRILRRLPREGSLDHLARDVLGLDGFDQLPSWLGRRLQARLP